MEPSSRSVPAVSFPVKLDGSTFSTFWGLLGWFGHCFGCSLCLIVLPITHEYRRYYRLFRHHWCDNIPSIFFKGRGRICQGQYPSEEEFKWKECSTFERGISVHTFLGPDGHSRGPQLGCLCASNRDSPLPQQHTPLLPHECELGSTILIINKNSLYFPYFNRMDSFQHFLIWPCSFCVTRWEWWQTTYDLETSSLLRPQGNYSTLLA